MPDSKTIQNISAAGPSARSVGRSVAGPTDVFWHRAEQMLAEIAAFAKAEPLPPDFPAQVLIRLHELLRTSAEIFWKSDLTGTLQQAAENLADGIQRQANQQGENSSGTNPPGANLPG